MKGIEIEGVVPPIITPFNKWGYVDVGALQRVIDYVIDGGVHGIFVTGSTGEFYALNAIEHKKAIEQTVEHVNGRVPVYAGTSAITTRDSIRLGLMAKEAGADAFTLLPPTFIQPNESELFQHFSTIAKSVDLPMILYNNPGKTNNNFSVELLRKLAEIDNVVGVKNTSLDFSQTIKYIEATKECANFKVMSGTDYYVFSSLMHGASGCVAGTANVAPKLVVEIYESFKRGDYAAALSAQQRLLPLRDLYHLGSFPVVMKDCLNVLGLDVGNSIKPINSVGEEKKQTIKEVLKELNLMD